MSAEQAARARSDGYRDPSSRAAGKAARIAVLDYGIGNLRSVEKAFERVGGDVAITSDPEAVARADGLVLPGVGAFAPAMQRVRELDLGRLIAESLAAGTPVFGICLGFQLLFESSSELGGDEGLGLLGGAVAALEAPGLKLPHMGWEPVRWQRETGLIDGIEDGTPFYFLHGFAPRPTDPGDILGFAEHGGPFVCAIARPPLYGVQFHPEKSSAAGLRLLSNFVRICAAVPA